LERRGAGAGDYDGDSRADIGVFNADTGRWYIRASSTGGWFGGGSIQWGAAGNIDIPVPGDYDGDGRFDLAVYNRYGGTWNIVRTRDWAWVSGAPIPWGFYGATPVGSR